MGERLLTTDDYRNAPTGTGPLSPTWADKPHRLVYDLATAVDDLRSQLATVTAERDSFEASNQLGSEQLGAARQRAAEAEADVERLRPSPEGAWAIVYDDADVEPELFYGAGAEEAARARMETVRLSWNAHLLAPAPPDTTPRGSALRAAKAKAWDEGYRDGVNRCADRAAAMGQKLFHRPGTGDNPYADTKVGEAKTPDPEGLI